MDIKETNEWISYNRCITESDWLIGIDPGHGGMVANHYETYPDKMYEHPDFSFYEGVFNRQIASGLALLLYKENISHFFTTTSNYDVGLNVRVIRANNLKKLYPEKKHLLLSIHANAAPKGQEAARGIEVFTSKGDTEADPHATVVFNYLSKMGWKMRKDMLDGDPDKEANFYILRHTISPAVLVELGFYTNYEEAKLMMQKSVQLKMITYLFNSIQEIIKSS